MVLIKIELDKCKIVCIMVSWFINWINMDFNGLDVKWIVIKKNG